jgi:hypothetical protein
MARAREFKRIRISDDEQALARERAEELNARDAAQSPGPPALLRVGQLPLGPGVPITEELLAESAAVLEHGPNPFRWVGFAAEHALARAINEGGQLEASLPSTYDYDLHLVDPASDLSACVEVKTRVNARGWTDPSRFDFVKVPTHDGREPIKAAADVVMFCWWSADDPGGLWVLGRVRGAREFKQRAVFYPEGAQMPRGRAPTGGAWCVDVAMLRPIPDGLIKETT